MTRDTSKANDLQRRLVAFAGSIIGVSAKLPRNQHGRHISAQILRSGTASAANYGEARGAESRADFVHKLGIVLKELNETAIWLDIIIQSSLLPGEQLAAVVAENRELSKIIATSVKTARGLQPAATSRN
jgi:four helix bundle protein